MTWMLLPRVRSGWGSCLRKCGAFTLVEIESHVRSRQIMGSCVQGVKLHI